LVCDLVNAITFVPMGCTENTSAFGIHKKVSSDTEAGSHGHTTKYQIGRYFLTDDVTVDLGITEAIQVQFVSLLIPLQAPMLVIQAGLALSLLE